MRTNMEAGHGGKSGRFEHLRELAEEYAFVISEALEAPIDGAVRDGAQQPVRVSRSTGAGSVARNGP